MVAGGGWEGAPVLVVLVGLALCRLGVSSWRMRAASGGCWTSPMVVFHGGRWRWEVDLVEAHVISSVAWQFRSAWLLFLSLFVAMVVDGGRGRGGPATTACGWLAWSGVRGWSVQASYPFPVGGWRRGWGCGCSEVFLRRCSFKELFDSGAVSDGSCGNQRSLAAIELRQSLGSWCSGLLSLRWSCGGAGDRNGRKIGMLCKRTLRGFATIFCSLRAFLHFLQDRCPSGCIQRVRVCMPRVSFLV